MTHLTHRQLRRRRAAIRYGLYPAQPCHACRIAAVLAAVVAAVALGLYY